MNANRAVVLKRSVPLFQRHPDANEDFDCVPWDTPAVLQEGEVLLESVCISLDPTVVFSLNTESVGHPVSPTPGTPIHGFTVAMVKESKNPAYEPGDAIQGWLPWIKLYSRKPPTDAGPFEFRRISADAFKHFPTSNYVGILGMPGLTAWGGLHKFLRPKEGETLVVSAASGAVGQIVIQLGKVKKMRVVGIAGSDAKCAWLEKELKLDAAINYKTCGSLEEALRNACPDGIDCYYDNVGGATFDAVLGNMNRHGRVAVCGCMSEYQGKGFAYKHMDKVLFRGLNIRGFSYVDVAEDGGLEEAMSGLEFLLQSKLITYKEDIAEGSIDLAPSLLVRVMKGQNFGKQSLRLV